MTHKLPNYSRVILQHTGSKNNVFKPTKQTLQHTHVTDYKFQFALQKKNDGRKTGQTVISGASEPAVFPTRTHTHTFELSLYLPFIYATTVFVQPNEYNELIPPAKVTDKSVTQLLLFVISNENNSCGFRPAQKRSRSKLFIGYVNVRPFQMELSMKKTKNSQKLRRFQKRTQNPGGYTNCYTHRFPLKLLKITTQHFKLITRDSTGTELSASRPFRLIITT